MTHGIPILERAFQLAEHDLARSIASLRSRLQGEGYSHEDLAQLTPSVVKKLNTLLHRRGGHLSADAPGTAPTD